MVALQEWVHHLNQCQQQGVMSFIENKFIIRGLELNEKFANWKNFFSVIDASGVQSLYSTVEDAKYALEKLL